MVIIRLSSVFVFTGLNLFMSFYIGLIGDETSLVEAIERLNLIDAILVKMIRYWDNMVVILNTLGRDTQTGDRFLKRLEKETYANRFRQCLDQAKHVRTFFKIIF